MTYLRYEVRALCRRRLGDLTSPYKFTDDQVNQWINDSIAAYSIHFPRTRSTTIACATDDQSYQMPAGTMQIQSVEYPDGEDPPVYLYRRDVTHPKFWEEDGYYAFTPASTNTSIATLEISENPTTGEDIVVVYDGEHDYMDDDDTDVLTVMERHLDLVILYVRMAAYQELAIMESANPDPTGLMSGTLELNAFRASREYRIALAAFMKKDTPDSSKIVAWKMDVNDRIY
jgi:hypothetical protein